MEDPLQADVVVIGMGPGGEHAAGLLAEAGLDVIGIEKRLVGGECPYWGCVPSKMMIRAANALAEGRRVVGLAGTAEVGPDWTVVARRIREEATDNWDDTAAVRRFESKGGKLIRGEGTLAGPGAVIVGDTRIEARRGVLLNPGTEPAVPPIEGLGELPYWTNREAIETEELPESLVVLGGGAIGLELGQVFARFGVRVTVIEAAERILSLEEPEASDLLEAVFAREGIEVRVGVAAKSARRDGSSLVVALADGTEVAGERLLVATGRRTNLEGLGLATVGLDPGQRWIPVDEHLRVAPGLWAIGDVTGKGLFTHVSMYQAGIAVADILGRVGPGADYTALPRVTFTDPEIGAVGMTEHAARAAGLDIRIAVAPIQESTRGWIHKAGNDGFIKLVADAASGTLVGATSAGPVGGEVLGLLGLGIHAQVPVAQMRTMIYAYPTFHRAIEATLDRLDLPDIARSGQPDAGG